MPSNEGSAEKQAPHFACEQLVLTVVREAIKLAKIILIREQQNRRS